MSFNFFSVFNSSRKNFPNISFMNVLASQGSFRSVPENLVVFRYVVSFSFDMRVSGSEKFGATNCEVLIGIGVNLVMYVLDMEFKESGYN